jgi:hypothetical protein
VRSPLGRSVRAKVLILKDGVTVGAAQDMLWKRETDNVGSRKHYPGLRTRKAVRVITIPGFAGVESVLYVDFYASTKIRNPRPATLAIRAIRSVNVSIKDARFDKDGITYLIKVKKSGVITPLTGQYEKEILRRTGTRSLKSALDILRKKYRTGAP